MGFWTHRADVVDLNTRPAMPAPKVRPGESRLEVREKRDAAEKAAEKAWKIDVWDRDEGKSRYSGKKLKRTMRLDPMRGERHHIHGRADKRVRWDSRAALLLELEIHEKVTRNELRIVGTVFFEVEGHTYIDARFPVKFIDTATGEVIK